MRIAVTSFVCALAVAALCGDGVTEVSRVHHIDRGYPTFEADLRSLGAHVERVQAPADPVFGL